LSAIFGELLTFHQECGPDVRLRVYGDEFYARYETEEGYSVIYEPGAGRFVYARLSKGRFVSSGVDLSCPVPPETPRHLEESSEVRAAAVRSRFPG